MRSVSGGPPFFLFSRRSQKVSLAKFRDPKASAGRSGPPAFSVCAGADRGVEGDHIGRWERTAV